MMTSNQPKHEHTNVCPFAVESSVDPHVFCPPQEGDSRSPCPALNALANHGYLPRNGQQITNKMLYNSICEVYQISGPVAYLLSYGGLLKLGKGGDYISLHDLARKEKLEHRASLFHADASIDSDYAPVVVDKVLTEETLSYSKDGVLFTMEDAAIARAKRQASYPPDQQISANQAFIARGEITILLNVFNNPNPELLAEHPEIHSSNGENGPLPGVPLDLIRTWVVEGRLPEGWKPYHTFTLWDLLKGTWNLKSGMDRISAELPGYGSGKSHGTRGLLEGGNTAGGISGVEEVVEDKKRK
ncbi:chloroperoxidase family protein [Abortiporus biennis]